MTRVFGNGKNSGKGWRSSVKLAAAILVTMMLGITLPDYLAASG